MKVLIVMALTAMLLNGNGSAAQTIEPIVLSGTDLPVGVTAPEPIKDSQVLHYPPMAVRCGLSGDVTLEIEVSEKGEVLDPKIEKSTGYTALDNAAISSVKKWRYKPATKDGVAIASRIQAIVQFKTPSSASPCEYLPPSAYSSGLPPNFSPVEPPDSSPLKPGEQLWNQDSLRIEPWILTRKQALHVPDQGETLRIGYSLNPAPSRIRLLVVTDEQHRDESRGITPTGPYPLDCAISGRGSQSVSLRSGEYWIVWLFADKPSDRILSYRETIAPN